MEEGIVLLYAAWGQINNSSYKRILDSTDTLLYKAFIHGALVNSEIMS